LTALAQLTSFTNEVIMAGTVVADTLQAASTSTLVLKNGVANTPPTIQDSAGTQIGTFCRAWVNFNGTGTVAIRASFNVSSITDRGTGLYTLNFTTALPDANYCGVASATIGGASNANRDAAVGPIDASSAYCNSWVADSGGAADVEVICAAIFR
jgi:hypothetical protein